MFFASWTKKYFPLITWQDFRRIIDDYNGLGSKTHQVIWMARCRRERERRGRQRRVDREGTIKKKKWAKK